MHGYQRPLIGNWGGNVQTCKVATFCYQISWTDSQTKWEICGRSETKRGKEKPSYWTRNGCGIGYESSDLGSMNGNLNKGRQYCSLKKGTRTIFLVSELYWVLIVFSSVAQLCLTLLESMQLQRIEYNWASELNWTDSFWKPWYSSIVSKNYVHCGFEFPSNSDLKNDITLPKFPTLHN